MDVSTSSPSIGFSIPGSATRRLKTYSVSLREKNFDISEVPVVPTDDGENLDHFISKTAKDKCGSCGQKVPVRRRTNLFFSITLVVTYLSIKSIYANIFSVA